MGGRTVLGLILLQLLVHDVCLVQASVETRTKLEDHFAEFGQLVQTIAQQISSKVSNGELKNTQMALERLITARPVSAAPQRLNANFARTAAAAAPLYMLRASGGDSHLTTILVGMMAVLTGLYFIGEKTLTQSSTPENLLGGFLMFAGIMLITSANSAGGGQAGGASPFGAAPPGFPGGPDGGLAQDEGLDGADSPLDLPSDLPPDVGEDPTGEFQKRRASAYYGKPAVAPFHGN